MPQPVRQSVLVFLFLAVAIVLLQGCATGPSTSDTDLRFISRASLIQAMHPAADQKGKPIKLALVDVRSAADYQKGHIPGAINIPFADLRADDSRLTGANLIVVYAEGWGDPLSAAAAKQLIALGYHDVREFRPGMASWQDNGPPGTAPAR